MQSTEPCSVCGSRAQEHLRNHQQDPRQMDFGGREAARPIATMNHTQILDGIQITLAQFGIRQHELAKAAGTSQGHISNILVTRRHGCSDKMLERLAAAMDVLREQRLSQRRAVGLIQDAIASLQQLSDMIGGSRA